MNYYMTLGSNNSKTGRIPVSTTSRETCPDACPLKNAGCYADGGPLRIHWDKVTKGERGTDFDSFLTQVSVMPPNQVWRYGQAGDFPGTGNVIDRDMMRKLVKANANRPVIAYTHKPPVGRNLTTLLEANQNGFTVNLSANNLNEADFLTKTNLPVVTLLPSEYGRGKGESLQEYNLRVKTLPNKTPAGNRIAVCPATYTDTNCGQCLACAKTDRSGTIIGFPAHGFRKNAIDRSFESIDDNSVAPQRTSERIGPALRVQ